MMLPGGPGPCRSVDRFPVPDMYGWITMTIADLRRELPELLFRMISGCSTTAGRS